MSVLSRLLPWSSGPPLSRASVATPAPVPAFVPVSQPEETSLPLAERRAQALRGMFPMLFSMYAQRADLWRAVAIERFLSGATNVTDLELRIHEVQRQTHFGGSI